MAKTFKQLQTDLVEAGSFSHKLVTMGRKINPFLKHKLLRKADDVFNKSEFAPHPGEGENGGRGKPTRYTDSKMGLQYALNINKITGNMYGPNAYGPGKSRKPFTKEDIDALANVLAEDDNNADAIVGAFDYNTKPSKQMAAFHNAEIKRLTPLALAAVDSGNHKLAATLSKKINFNKLAAKHHYTEETAQDNDVLVEEEIKKGAFHRWLGKDPSEKLSPEDIERGLKSNDPHVRKMANFAKNAKQWHHESVDESIKAEEEEKTTSNNINKPKTSLKSLLNIKGNQRIPSYDITRALNSGDPQIVAAAKYHMKYESTVADNEIPKEGAEKLEEGLNYHSVFVHHNGEWEHHADFDNMEDAREEKDFLKRQGQKAYHAVVPKFAANWDVPGSANKFMIKKLNAMPAKPTEKKNNVRVVKSKIKYED